MQYLVTMEFVEPGALLAPQQVPTLYRSTIFPTQEAWARMESEGKIHGGIVAGARKAVFMLEADSNEEVNQILQGMPAWGVLKVEVTPLLSFETRREHEEQALQQLEASLQQ